MSVVVVGVFFDGFDGGGGGGVDGAVYGHMRLFAEGAIIVVPLGWLRAAAIRATLEKRPLESFMQDTD